MNKMRLLIASVLLLTACSGSEDTSEDSQTQSLTGANYSGKKYYLGWGHASSGDPANMHNEVKYDVLHTHEIFTKDIGGSYAGSQLVGQGSNQAILNAFNQIKSSMTANDMFVQYSSGHGFEQGLQFGGSYEEISSRILSLPAKEIVVFTMACHSGGLVNSFKNKQAVWQNFASQGRTLFVMASSTVQQTSSSGPGSANGGPYGSAGSAFGHALWKALSGEADGAYDGVKDGFIDLGEIETYVKARTKQIGGHDPVTTGSYNPALIMNQSPGTGSLSNLSYANNGTSNASDAQLQQMVRQEDSLWMNQNILGQIMRQ